MDVQAASAIATLAPVSTSGLPAQPAPKSDGTTAAALAAITVVPPASGSGTSGSGASADSTIGPTPGLATLPAGPPDGSKKGSSSDPTLAGGIAKLFNSEEQNISVSFQVEQDPNEIVTVFTDKQTGKVIVQFPSETLIALAKFFDKLDGSVLNKKV